MNAGQTIAVVAVWAAVGYSAPYLGFFTIFFAAIALIATLAVTK